MWGVYIGERYEIGFVTVTKMFLRVRIETRSLINWADLTFGVREGDIMNPWPRWGLVCWKKRRRRLSITSSWIMSGIVGRDLSIGNLVS